MIYGPGMMPPTGRPDIARATAIQWARSAGCEAGVFIFGRRGYFRDSMGVKGKNERAVYDDAMGIVTPDYFAVFNANTDPVGQGGRLATLVPGVYDYDIGTHHPGTPKAAPCLVQAGPVTVHRDNGVTESGEFQIHIHRGFFNECGSLGCQTIPPTQWSHADDDRGGAGAPFFFDDVSRIMQELKLKTIPYVLTERPDE